MSDRAPTVPQSVFDDYDDDALENQFLTFIVAGSVYGIDIQHVLEIVGMLPITEIPNSPDHIEGVINLRGVVIPVVTFRRRFGLERKEYDEQTCIIVVNVRKMTIGVIVDQVLEVMMVDPSQISSPSGLKEKYENRFIQGMARLEETVMILLDADKFLFDAECPHSASNTSTDNRVGGSV